MKHLKVLLLVIMSLMVLTACEKEKKEEEIAVQFVEYKDDYAIFVSHEEKQYYKMYMNKYEKDFQTESIESITKIYEKQPVNIFDSHKIYTKLDDKEKRLSEYH